MAVAKTNKEEKWELIGILTFLDPPRPDTKDTIDKSMAFGVDVKMVSSVPFPYPIFPPEPLLHSQSGAHALSYRS
jgi:hypothetical protein